MKKSAVAPEGLWDGMDAEMQRYALIGLICNIRIDSFGELYTNRQLVMAWADGPANEELDKGIGQNCQNAECARRSCGKLWGKLRINEK